MTALCEVANGTAHCESSRGRLVRTRCKLCDRPACQQCTQIIQQEKSDRRVCYDCIDRLAKGETPHVAPQAPTVC